MTDSNVPEVDPGKQVVPFGKYKGQPLEVMLLDRQYCEYMAAQAWFPDRYPVIHQTIINYGGTPQDSPEHNQMQAQFLDRDRCLALARLVDDQRDYAVPPIDRGELLWLERWRSEYPELLNESVIPAAAKDVRFEDHGWDVTFTIDLPVLTVDLLGVPPCGCGPCDHSDCSPDAPCQTAGNLKPWGCRHDRCRDRKADHAGPDHHETCRWHMSYGGGYVDRADPKQAMQWWNDGKGHTFGGWGSPAFRVELKPDLGDDFPTVLRQVKRYPANLGDLRVVVARRAAFAHVTWEQVQEMFAADGVALVRESDIQTPALPAGGSAGEEPETAAIAAPTTEAGPVTEHADQVAEMIRTLRNMTDHYLEHDQWNGVSVRPVLLRTSIEAATRALKTTLGYLNEIDGAVQGPSRLH